ncbi:hypothetical protein DE146DRAFT_302210 [Phaeosphaeria sp. MPI-PUGE-AT-0046c]|nr:hypothetical protein DE146DRAFT_302210 [Phaeosphaeria sp. MPI-PUGE-AT-0046c]
MIRVKYDRVSVSVSGLKTARIAPDIGGGTAAGRVLQWPCCVQLRERVLVVSGGERAEWCWREVPFQTGRALEAARRYPKHAYGKGCLLRGGTLTAMQCCVECWQSLVQRIDEASQRYRFCLDEASHRGSRQARRVAVRSAVGVKCWLKPPSPAPRANQQGCCVLEAVHAKIGCAAQWRARWSGLRAHWHARQTTAMPSRHDCDNDDDGGACP